MTTETTTTASLPPCPLKDCHGGPHHYHDILIYDARMRRAHVCDEVRECFSEYQPARPHLVVLPEVTAEMVEAARRAWLDGDTATAGWWAAAAAVRDALTAGLPLWEEVAPGTAIEKGVWVREEWGSGSAEYRTEVSQVAPTLPEAKTFIDPRTIPADPDDALIEKLIGLLDLTDSEDAREVIAAVRAHGQSSS